jgi:cytochrome b561
MQSPWWINNMPLASDTTPTWTFAHHCFRVSRILHWLTVALVSGLLVTALGWNIDPHGSGNPAFLWHSSLGISVYLLSMARLLLWFVYRPASAQAGGPEAQGGGPGVRFAFYALLLALPFSGWLLASSEGMAAHPFGIPSLPQWYQRMAPPSSAVGSPQKSHDAATKDTDTVVNLQRIHAALTVALSAVIVTHLVAVIRDRTRRRDELQPGARNSVGKRII